MRLLMLSAALLFSVQYVHAQGALGGWELPEAGGFGAPAPQAVPAEFPPEAMPPGIPGSRPPEAAVPPGDCRMRFIDTAASHSGASYKLGKSAGNQFDCSGLVVAALRELKDAGTPGCPGDIGLLDSIVKNRSTDHMWPEIERRGLAIQHNELREKLRPGDLIFSDDGYNVPAGLPGHVFIFVAFAEGNEIEVVESGGTGNRGVAREKRQLPSDARGASMTPVLGE